MYSRLFTEKKRVFILVLISLLMNSILFLISYFFDLPLWLDTTGTIYISCIIGFPAGFLVSIIMNISESIWMYGESSLLFYFVSLLTAFVSGSIYKKYKTTKAKKWVIMFFSLIFVGCGSAVVITIGVNNGIPANYWSLRLYDFFMKKEFDKTVSTTLAVSIVKCMDIIVTLLIVCIAIRITPKKIKTREFVVQKKIEENINENRL